MRRLYQQLMTGACRPTKVVWSCYAPLVALIGLAILACVVDHAGQTYSYFFCSLGTLTLLPWHLFLVQPMYAHTRPTESGPSRLRWAWVLLLIIVTIQSLIWLLVILYGLWFLVALHFYL